MLLTTVVLSNETTIIFNSLHANSDFIAEPIENTIIELLYKRNCFPDNYKCNHQNQFSTVLQGIKA